MFSLITEKDTVIKHSNLNLTCTSPLYMVDIFAVNMVDIFAVNGNESENYPASLHIVGKHV